MKLRKLLSIIIAVSITLSSAFIINSSALDAVEQKYNPDCPYIHVVGLMSSDIYVGDDCEAETVFPPSSKSIIKGVAKLLPALFKLGITRNYDKFGDSLVDAVNTILGPAQLDSNGNINNGTGAGFVFPEKSEIKKDSLLWYYYDWRVDPVETADNLNDFIDYVLDATNCKQVVLECHSFGGVVTLAYCKKYTSSKLKSVLFNASAVYGETFTGDLCMGKLHLYDDALTEYLKGAFANQDGEKFFNGLFSFLYKIKFTKCLCDKINNIIDNCHDQLFDEVIYPLFAHWPSIWSMVTDDMYDEAFDYVFNNVWKDEQSEHAGLREKVEYYHYNIALKREDILKIVNEISNLYVVCRYGYCSMFCTPSWRVQNDMIVDVKSASFGATASQYGEKLASAQVEGVEDKYISPDGSINAKTCLFPDQTWFIYDYMHMRSKPDDMFETLLYNDTQATVDTFVQYPRYLVNEDFGIPVPAK